MRKYVKTETISRTFIMKYFEKITDEVRTSIKMNCLLCLELYSMDGLTDLVHIL